MWRKPNDQSTPQDRQDRPISQERLIELMKENDWKYAIDSEGVVTGRWDNADVYFNLLRLWGEEPDGLQVRAYWRHELPASAEVSAATVANAWHRDKLFPKLYARVDGEKTVIVAEGSFPLRFGISNQQLNDIVNAIISTSIDAFKAFEEHFNGQAAGLPKFDGN